MRHRRAPTAASPGPSHPVVLVPGGFLSPTKDPSWTYYFGAALAVAGHSACVFEKADFLKSPSPSSGIAVYV